VAGREEETERINEVLVAKKQVANAVRNIRRSNPENEKKEEIKS
jgi:hypothetical protein